jgi:hypothetical protein
MSRLKEAKAYAYSIRHDGYPGELVTAMAADLFMLDRHERRELHQFVLQRCVAKCDATLCGPAGLRALRLPMNRIAEAFQ